MNGGGPGQRFVPRPCSWKGQKTGSEPQEPTKRNILKAPPVSLQERMKDEEISEMEVRLCGTTEFGPHGFVMSLQRPAQLQ
ncbi:uncharacterized protein N7473_002095 [Penicillium subrubescens]|uniref:uncharacterized protein n=1 Tax=Penicillium subrubescens TaxID=1316194 RepID=UPI002545A9BF|nr:uncharacterized protein N7473_002095 [Penicillium subrubescens]KAJ5905179.1 hypothetical protein N7473_002095 [Penicillium subrubescens]